MLNKTHLNSNLALCGTVDLLYKFTGNVSTKVNVPDLSNYKTLILAITSNDSAQSFVNSITIPSSTFWTGGVSTKVYGVSSDTWGSCIAEAMVSTSVTFNRTTATTSSVQLFGVK